MSKNAVTDWSATDSLNTDIGGTNIAEGCAPGGINDAIRKLMSQIATFITAPTFSGLITGTAATLSGALTSATAAISGALSTASAAISGNATIGGTLAITGTASATGSFTTAANLYAGQGLLITGSASPLGVGARIEYGAGRAIFGAFDYGSGVLKGVDVNGTTIRLQTGAAGTATTRLTIADTAITSAVNFAADGSIFAGGGLDGVSPGGGSSGGVRVRTDAGNAGAYIQFTNNNASSELAHVRFEPGTGKMTINIGNLDVLSVDSAGNVRARGTVTQSVVP